MSSTLELPSSASMADEQRDESRNSEQTEPPIIEPVEIIIEREVNETQDDDHHDDDRDDDGDDENEVQEIAIDYSTVTPNVDMGKNVIIQSRFDDARYINSLSVNEKGSRVYITNDIYNINLTDRELNKQILFKKKSVKQTEILLQKVDNMHKRIRSKESELSKYRKNIRHGKSIEIDNMKRDYNALVASLRNMKFYSLVSAKDKCSGIKPTEYCFDKDWFQNICKPRGIKSNRSKKPVKAGDWDPVSKCPHYDDMEMFHESRRTLCMYPKGQLLPFLELGMTKAFLGRTHNPDIRGNVRNLRVPQTSAQANTDKVGMERVCPKFKSSKYHILTDEDNLLAPCPCFPRAEAPDTPCGKFFLLTDLAMINNLPPEDVELYKTKIENTRIQLLRKKYGSTYATYCINTNCVHATTPYFDQTIVNALSGLMQTSVHINERTCPECATNWCSECCVQPYHKRQICPGKIYELCKDMSPEDKAECLKNTKLCPGCEAPTQLAIGCDHLTCITCKSHWCWRCRGFRDDPASRYRHKCPVDIDYDKEQDPNDSGNVTNHGHDVRKALTIALAKKK